MSLGFPRAVGGERESDLGTKNKRFIEHKTTNNIFKKKVEEKLYIFYY